MKHYEGPFLDWLRQRPPEPLPLQVVAHVIRQATAILQNAHDRGVVHQHISPACFIARTTGENPAFPDLQITGFGQVQGTPLWMAPEEWQGAVVAATDQYALAVVAYQLLTWQSPFEGTPEQLRQQHLNAHPRPPSQLNPRIPSAIDAVVLRALAKRPQERYPSISAFADAFQQAVQIPARVVSANEAQSQDIAAARLTTPIASSAIPTPNIPNQSSNVLPLPVVTHLSPAAQLREILILGIVFLIVVSGIGFGFYSVVKSSQLTANSMDATKQTTAIPASSAVVFPSTTITGVPYLEDNLSSNPTGRWDNDGTACAFKGGTYHVLLQQAGQLQLCGMTTPLILDNVAIEVDVSLLAGHDAGFILRDVAEKVQFYDFEITNAGTFYFNRRDGKTTITHLIREQKASTIAPQKNTLLIIAKGDDFKLFINTVLVGEVHDSSYPSGQIGLVMGTEASNINGDASFSHLKIFKV